MIGNARTACARRQMVSAGLYKAQEPAGQFANPVVLATVDRLRRDQLPANPQGNCPSNDKLAGIVLRHAPGGH